MGTQSAVRRAPSGEPLLPLLLVLFLFGAAAVVFAGLVAGWRLAGAPIEWNPVQAGIDLAMRQRSWPVQATVLAPLFLAVYMFAVLFAVVRRAGGRSHSVDAAARTMAPQQQLRDVTGKRAAKTAARLAPALTARDGKKALPGLPLGRTVGKEMPLWMDWESMAVCVAGQRTGKTTCYAIPALMDAPGAVIATSNKRDLHDATRLHREQTGTVWLMDLQAVTGRAHVTFWWNPLTLVRTVEDARSLASYFAAASRQDTSRVDSYFDGGAEGLLWLHMLAAASVGGDLIHVFTWLHQDQDDTPAVLLDHAGHALPAMRVRVAQGLNDRQRDGLFDMARKLLEGLLSTAQADVITPPSRVDIKVSGGHPLIRHLPPAHERPEFDPSGFAASTDTLYVLSVEGGDSADALTTALVGQVLDCARKTSSACPGGRLPIPMVGVLDEAANIVKIRDLPKWYSHFGSRGILLMTFIQSRDQAELVWGRDETKALINGAISIYGGNVRDTAYLEDLSRRIGEHDVAVSSRSISAHGGGWQQSWKRERIMPIEELGALPRDRAIIELPGHAPVLAAKVSWQQTRHKDAVEQSLRLYGETTANGEVS